MTTSEDVSAHGAEKAEIYKVPKTSVCVRVLLEGGSLLEGALYLATGAPDHEGRERVVDLLERERRFIPMTLEGETLLLSTDRIAVVYVEHPRDVGLEGPALDLPIPEIPVAVRLTSNMAHPDPIIGQMRLDLPTRRGRVLDLLNDEKKFVVVVGDGELLLISKHYISSVVQTADAS